MFWVAFLASGLLSFAARADTVTNTAQATFTTPDGPTSQDSNTVSIVTVPPPTTAVVTFYQYAPGVAGSTLLAFDGGMYDIGGGNFVALPDPQALDGSSISTASPVEVRETRVFHVREPVFITLADANRNLDAAVREIIEVTVTTSTGDTEVLRLQETGPDTGVFSAALQSAPLTSGIVPGDGRLTLEPNSTIEVDYQDIYYPSDTALDTALVDPFGVVFDTETGLPLDGVVVTLIDMSTGLPATVFGDDGVSTFPATLTTGGSASDSGGTVYNFPAGGFRFPFVAPGDYRFDVQPTPGYAAPSTVPPGSMPTGPGGVVYSVTNGSFSDTFTIAPGPALNIDIPADPQRSELLLQKTVSQAEASTGDFLQYRLQLNNTDTVFSVSAISMTDRLPFGMVFQSGSLRVDGVQVADPVIAADGRTLTMALGDLPAGGTRQVSYVVMVGPGVRVGDAVNEAQATGNAGIVQSNLALVPVKIKEPFFSDRFTIIGRVFDGDCSKPWEGLNGVANVRIMLEDGTYVVTDEDGQYHIEGVRPGTHVVQLDTDSLPADREPVSCVDNTRFGGTPYSQFVDVKGGGLWRADFFVKQRTDDVGIRVNTRMDMAPAPPPAPAEVSALEPSALPLPAPVQPEPKKFSVEFDDCRSELTEGARSVIARVVSDIPADAVARVEVIGHTDSRPLSKRCAAIYHDNRGLSRARAKAVGDALATGLSLKPEQVKARGEGLGLPIANNKTKDGRAKNRRTEGRVHLRDTAVPGAVVPVVPGSDATPLAPPAAADAGAMQVVGITNSVEVDGSGPVRDLRVMALLPDGYTYDTTSTQVDGQPAEAPTIDGALLQFHLGEVKDDKPWRRVITFRVVPAQPAQAEAPAAPAVSPASVPAAAPACNAAYQVKALVNVESLTSQRTQSPAAESQVACPAPAAATTGAATTGAATEAAASAAAAVVEHTGERQHVQVDTLRTRTSALPPEVAERRKIRESIPDTPTASGANTNWFEGQQPGIGWVFPATGYNPRAPATRIVIKHGPQETVTLTYANGTPVGALNFDGISFDATGRIAMSIWRGVALQDGNNGFVADVKDAAGNVVQRLEHTVVFAGKPARAELVPEQSILVADGITRPVLAVRFLDRDGNPVRDGITGNYQLARPFVPWEQVEAQQGRQLGGLERFAPSYHVEGDNGIAYIELAPTTEAGNVEIAFAFEGGERISRAQELRAWMETAPRDWVVVGFAEGTVGYNTLKDNIQPLLEDGVDDGAYSNGQVSLYAKGRVKGEWLMTMAYDSMEKDQKDRDESLLSTIDPDEYYTLYGDGAEQGYDTPSQDNLYLRLERGQFYALFGDYDTGMVRTDLARYSRRMNGLKVEDGGGPLTYVLFAAETPQNYAHDEIQGDGTSGLYRLSQANIVLNSETVRIETRDRLHAEQVVASKSLARHLDYDIDYSNGTIFFKQPIPVRDQDFNPVIIVAEYETLDAADATVNAGGRVALALDKGGRTTVGVSVIRDEDNFGTTELVGGDLTMRLAADTELRLEAAGSNGDAPSVNRDGDAWLAELEHHSGRYDALFYTRRQDATFGVGQQSYGERGQQTTGLDGQVRLDGFWSVEGQVYNQENVSTDDTRNALIGRLRYETDAGGFSVGGQVIEDSAGSGTLAGQDFRSEQATITGNRWFMARRLELSAQADAAIGGNNESVDFPNRFLLGAGFQLSKRVRLLAAQEFTEGRTFDSSSTRVGLQAQPWAGARVETTLNQTNMGEYGPRTFGQYGLTQAVLINDRWSMDFSADATNTFNETGQPELVINPAHPVTAGGTLSTLGITEDFYAFSTGATYRAPVWSWNGRAETRMGEVTDRYGLVSNFLHQATHGVAFASSAEVFRSEQTTGMDGLLASIDFSLAWRPLGQHWSVLNRLELRFEDVEDGALATTGLFGNNSLVANDASTRRIINNLAINRVSREWTGKDRQGNLFNRYERNQWSFYYGAKYAQDTFDGVDYSGYTDLLGFEVRHDINPRWDIGLQASTLNSWSEHQHEYSVGPMAGWSPVKNGWITLGYNVRGFYDQDFDAARYTAEGPYLQLRLKFDQNTRLWKKESESDAARP